MYLHTRIKYFQCDILIEEEKKKTEKIRERERFLFFLWVLFSFDSFLIYKVVIIFIGI